MNSLSLILGLLAKVKMHQSQKMLAILTSKTCCLTGARLWVLPCEKRDDCVSSAFPSKVIWSTKKASNFLSFLFKQQLRSVTWLRVGISSWTEVSVHSTKITRIGNRNIADLKQLKNLFHIKHYFFAMSQCYRVNSRLLLDNSRQLVTIQAVDLHDLHLFANKTDLNTLFNMYLIREISVEVRLISV